MSEYRASATVLDRESDRHWPVATSLAMLVIAVTLSVCALATTVRSDLIDSDHCDGQQFHNVPARAHAGFVAMTT